MTMPQLLSAFTTLDFGAVAFLLFCALVIGWGVEHPPARRPSVSVLMAEYQRDWMVQFANRDPRIFDSNVLDSLRRGTTFFASACMISLGSGIAVIGNSDQLASLAADLTLDAQGMMLELKVLLVLVFLANALLKFIWAHRLFGYCTIMMAAVPNDPSDLATLPGAAAAGEINITAARSFNRGLRSVYFALGALGWLLGGYALIFTTFVTLMMLVRREFFSHSRAIIMQRMHR